jgi:hypothetical protein
MDFRSCQIDHYLRLTCNGTRQLDVGYPKVYIDLLACYPELIDHALNLQELFFGVIKFSIRYKNNQFIHYCLLFTDSNLAS